MRRPRSYRWCLCLSLRGFVVLAVPFRAFICLCCLPLSTPREASSLRAGAPTKRKSINIHSFPYRAHILKGSSLPSPVETKGKNRRENLLWGEKSVASFSFWLHIFCGLCSRPGIGPLPSAVKTHRVLTARSPGLLLSSRS